MGTTLRRLVGVVAGGLALAACVVAIPPTDPPPGAVQAGARPAWCHPLALRTCALPYPSDFYTAPDPTSATGRRVAVPDAAMPEALRRQISAELWPSKLLTGDGFSAAGPVVFEVAHPVDPASLPKDGGSVLLVVDADTGARVPIHAQVDAEAARRGAAGSIVRAFPRARFEWGHRYLAVLSTGLRATDGLAYRPPPAVAAALDARPDLVALLGAQGFARASVLSFTEFTVRTEADATSTMDAIAGEVRAAEHPVRDLRAWPNILFVPDVSTIVTGQVRCLDYRTGPDGTLGAPEESWLDFLLTIPSVRPDGGAPVAIYGHGLGIFKESIVLLAGENARLGVATIAIDQPNHGSRADREGGDFWSLVASPERASRLVASPMQSTVDHLALLRAIQTSLAGLDAAPLNLFRPLAADGVADLNPQRVLYEGTSLGGVFGTTFVALAPELLGAAVQVGGVGITHDLSESVFWTFGLNGAPGGIRGVVPVGASAGDAALFMAMAQHALDGGDAINFVTRIRANGTPYLNVYAVGDRTVTNDVSNALAELLGLPLFGRVIAPVPGVPVVAELPADGFGTTQLDAQQIALLPDPLGGLLAHAQGAVNGSAPIIREWLRARL